MNRTVPYVCVTWTCYPVYRALLLLARLRVSEQHTRPGRGRTLIIIFVHNWRCKKRDVGASLACSMPPGGRPARHFCGASQSLAASASEPQRQAGCGSHCCKGISRDLKSREDQVMKPEGKEEEHLDQDAGRPYVVLCGARGKYGARPTSTRRGWKAKMRWIEGWGRWKPNGWVSAAQERSSRTWGKDRGGEAPGCPVCDVL